MRQESYKKGIRKVSMEDLAVPCTLNRKVKCSEVVREKQKLITIWRIRTQELLKRWTLIIQVFNQSKALNVGWQNHSFTEYAMNRKVNLHFKIT